MEELDDDLADDDVDDGADDLFDDGAADAIVDIIEIAADLAGWTDSADRPLPIDGLSAAAQADLVDATRGYLLAVDHIIARELG